MSILYIAPFLEKNIYREAATNNVQALSKVMPITCRAIGEKQVPNDIFKLHEKSQPSYDYLIVHGNPENFIWKSGFKKVIGITHIRSPLISETNFHNFFAIPDEVYHDSSFIIDGIKNIKPVFVPPDKIEITENKNNVFKFLINGSPFAYEEVHGVIRAFYEEFRQEEMVELVVKGTESFDIKTFSENLEGLHISTRKYNNKAYCPVGFVNNWMTTSELFRFYTEFDCFLNCSLYNIWSRPIIEGLHLNKRCISLIEEVRPEQKMAYGFSEHKDYPVGVSPTLAVPEVRKVLRKAFDNKGVNRLHSEDFQGEKALTQLMAIFK